MHVPLYLKKDSEIQQHLGGKEKKTSPQFILDTNLTYQLKHWTYSNWTQKSPCRGLCHGKILFIPLSKGTHWSCFKFIVCDWSLTIFILSSGKHMLEICLDRRVSSGWSNTPCTITWLDTGSTILITEGNCQGWKSRAAHSYAKPILKLNLLPTRTNTIGQL